MFNLLLCRFLWLSHEVVPKVFCDDWDVSLFEVIEVLHIWGKGLDDGQVCYPE